MLEHLKCLHAVMAEDSDPWGVAFCGMVLFCVCARARWSDAQHSQFIEWDVDSAGIICYAEFSTAVHKTCRALNMRHAFLPLTAPGKGVVGGGWAEHLHRARQELQIGDLSCQHLMKGVSHQSDHSRGRQVAVRGFATTGGQTFIA
eukprot:s2122_g17.t1